MKIKKREKSNNCAIKLRKKYSEMKILLLNEKKR